MGYKIRPPMHAFHLLARGKPRRLNHLLASNVHSVSCFTFPLEDTIPRRYLFSGSG